MTRILNGKEKTMKENVVEIGRYVQLSTVQFEVDNTNRPTHHRLQRSRELSSDPGGEDNTSTPASLERVSTRVVVVVVVTQPDRLPTHARESSA